MKQASSIMVRFLSAVLFILACDAAVAQIRPPTWPDVPLPGGSIRNVILDNCTACHGIDDYAFYALERDSWDELLNDKHTGSNSFEVSASEKIILLDYLASTFGPESIAFPRDYVAPEIDEFFADADARIFMEVRCISCHSLDPVFNMRLSEEGWRALLVRQRALGAQLDDEELEQLTEWLGRVRGVNLFE
jgi:mono/diheme cytochrome c family protein